MSYGHTSNFLSFCFMCFWYSFGGKWKTCENMTDGYDSCYWNASSYPAPESDIDVRVSIIDTNRGVTKTISKTFNKYDIGKC